MSVIINISLPDTLTMRMKLPFQGIGEVILLSIVKLKVLKIFVMKGKPEENEVPIIPIIHLNSHELHLPPLAMILLVHVYFHMNTKERHIMNVFRRFLEMVMKIIGVQQN